jgi:hypothetical protein
MTVFTGYHRVSGRHYDIYYRGCGNRVLIEMFGTKVKKVSEGWRILHSE